MSHTILVGVDGSDCSRRAIDFAAQEAKESNSNIVVAYVIEWSPYSFNTPEENEQRHLRREEEIQRATNHVLEPMMKSLKNQSIAAKGVVLHGNVADTLTTLAAKHEASEIVIGRIGDSGIKSMLFGSVASKLVQVSTVPVTVVP